MGSTIKSADAWGGNPWWGGHMVLRYELLNPINGTIERAPWSTDDLPYVHVPELALTCSMYDTPTTVLPGSGITELQNSAGSVNTTSKLNLSPSGSRETVPHQAPSSIYLSQKDTACSPTILAS